MLCKKPQLHAALFVSALMVAGCSSSSSDLLVEAVDDAETVTDADSEVDLPDTDTDTVADGATDAPDVVTGTDADPAETMTFFLTSAGPGDGGNLGGLPGADAHCANLAEAAGAAHG